MLIVGFIVVSFTTAENKCKVVVVVVAVGLKFDVIVVVVVVVAVVVVVVVVVLVVVGDPVDVLVVAVVVDLVGEERLPPHLVLHGQHLPVRKLTHLFFLGWYLQSLKHEE